MVGMIIGDYFELGFVFMVSWIPLSKCICKGLLTVYFARKSFREKQIYLYTNLAVGTFCYLHKSYWWWCLQTT